MNLGYKIARSSFRGALGIVFAVVLAACDKPSDGKSVSSLETQTPVKAGLRAKTVSGSTGVDLSQFTMTFNDEFDSLSISDSNSNDGSTWYTQTKICCGPIHISGINSPQNPFSLIPGGGLNIRAKLNENGEWSSGIINSMSPDGKGFAQKYGYFEMMAKFPRGEGTWPAFWLLNSANLFGAPSGEIDIVEQYGKWPTAYHTTLHDWSTGAVPAETTIWGADTTADYHTYAMLWTEEWMTFYFDGVENYKVPTPEIMKQPYWLIVNLGMGNQGFPENSPAVNDMLVKYVRAYALPGTGAVGVPVLTPVPVATKAPVAAESWVRCAAEDEDCSFKGTALVRYGIEGHYVTMTFTDGVGCNNEVFGDPAYGYRKSCEYMLTSEVTPKPLPLPVTAGSWVRCAAEDEHCTFKGTALVRYGIEGHYVTLTFTDGVGCNNEVFGDPAYGYRKSCDVFVNSDE